MDSQKHHISVIWNVYMKVEQGHAIYMSSANSEHEVLGPSAFGIQELILVRMSISNYDFRQKK
jgi:hypothetical protein